MSHEPSFRRERRFSDKTARERADNLRRTAPAPSRPWDQVAGKSAGSTGAKVGPDPAGRRARLEIGMRGAVSPPDLTPVEEPLTADMARHLLRRTSFGARASHVEQLIGTPANEAVAQVLGDAFNDSVYRRPGWADERPPHEHASDAAFEAFFELNDAWMELYVGSLINEWAIGGPRQRMMLFWHDHFATSYNKYELAAFAVRHMELLRTHALGNLKVMIHAITIDPAMLYYLDGFLNDKHAPNENYARELLELFTMGRTSPEGTPNYDENDISELARAMTGWTVNLTTLSSDFYPALFDTESKTIFGRPGGWTAKTAVDLIFTVRGRQVAHFITEKIFREFAHQEPDPDVVAAMAQQFQAGGLITGNLLRTLLQSKYFWDSEGTVGARIKSPIELLVGQVREYDMPMGGSLAEALYWESTEAGQQVFFPPNVAGWTGHQDWLNTSSLPARWNSSSWLTYFGGQEANDALIAWCNRLAPPTDATQAFHLPLAMVQHFIGVPWQHLNLPTRPSGFGGDLVQFPIPDTVRSELPREAVALASDMLSGLPWYEWDITNPGALALVRFFLSGVVQRPEYQLM
ncbi:MAG: DUF1800 domain-containing protein [Rhodothermales bacterium]|nr:DUF1800 domain-containing protein [Rhodothermales bacterium]MBO6780520.1 DUF1800 domain-containing protein [Rhodothermales bacterium]